MSHPVIWTLVGVVTGVIATLLVMRSFRTSPGGASKPGLPTHPLGMPSHSNEHELAGLRQNLRLKVLYDEAKIDRLIQAERDRAPNAGLAELMRNAIDRWERDNH
jgi:hypothetical protein